MTKCKFLRDPLLTTRNGYIFRKKFPHTETIDRELLWLAAYGLRENRYELQRNQGIWVPDSGPCDLGGGEQKAICSLQSNSRHYSWSQRDKESAKIDRISFYLRQSRSISCLPSPFRTIQKFCLVDYYLST